MQKFRVFSVLLLTTAIAFWLSTYPLAQNQVAETWLVASDEDCEPPCWLGIIPGESTAADVEQLFVDYNHLFFIPRSNDDKHYEYDTETGYIVNGYYGFFWRQYNRDDYPQVGNIIAIEDGIVTLVGLRSNEFVTLGEVLDTFGQPDDVSLMTHYGYSSIQMIYTNALLEIDLMSEFQGVCQIENLHDDFYTDTIFYYSIDEAVKIVETEHGNQPRLLAYTGSLKRQIPMDTWETWLNGEVEAYCMEAWNILPETVELPEFPMADN